MKLYCVLPIVFLFIALMFSANFSKAQGKTGELILGKWKIEPSQIPGMIDESIAMTRKQNEEQANQMEANKEMMKTIFANTVMEYKSDKSFYLDIPAPANPQSGTWKLSEDGKKITRTNTEGQERVNEIVAISKDQMTIINDRKQKVTYLRVTE